MLNPEQLSSQSERRESPTLTFAQAEAALEQMELKQPLSPEAKIAWLRDWALASFAAALVEAEADKAV